MELEIKKCGGGYAFYKKGNDKRLIYVYSFDIPKDFDAKRTARMIEKMEYLRHFVELHYKSLLPERYDMENANIKEVLDYIEHGDKEETVMVGVFPPIHKQSGAYIETHEIPKSKAIKLGLIKE